MFNFESDVHCLPTEYEVFTVLKATKMTSSVPNDFPIPFLKEFLPFLAKPVQKIFTGSIHSGPYPTQWKTEYVNPHPKKLPPETFDDLRNLSLTEYLSKSFEQFILRGTESINGLLFYITKYFDPYQNHSRWETELL